MCKEVPWKLNSHSRREMLVAEKAMAQGSATSQAGHTSGATKPGLDGQVTGQKDPGHPIILFMR